MPPDPILIEANAIMAAHAKATMEIYALTGWQPHRDDFVTARSLARSGVSVTTCEPVLRRLLERRRDQAKRPPKTLAYFEDELRNPVQKPNGSGRAPGVDTTPHRAGFLSNEQRADLIARKPPEDREAALAALDPATRSAVEALIPHFLPANELIGEIPPALRRKG